MVPSDDDAAPEARPPGVADLVSLCRSLNRARARYIVIGGMAIIQVGFLRATEDIDLKDRLDRVFLASLLGEHER